MNYLIDNHQNIAAFMDNLNKNEDIQKAFIHEAYDPVLTGIKDRMRKGLVMKEKEGGDVGIGLEHPLEAYLTAEDMKKILGAVPNINKLDGLFLEGYFYCSIIRLMAERFLPALAAEKAPVADPEGRIAEMLGTNPQPSNPSS